MIGTTTTKIPIIDFAPFREGDACTRQAIATSKTAIQQYQEQGNITDAIIATRNLALIYQQLGEWQQAIATLKQAELTIATIDDRSQGDLLLAQVLEVKGQIELSLGRSQNALDTWKEATALYQEQQNITGLTQATIPSIKLMPYKH